MWECPECGVQTEVGCRECAGGCGFVRMPVVCRIRGVEPGAQLVMRVQTAVGRRLLRRLDSNDARFASEPQFVVAPERERGGWVLRHAPGAANTTRISGNPIPSDGTLLQDGDEISIGAGKLLMRIELEET